MNKLIYVSVFVGLLCCSCVSPNGHTFPGKWSYKEDADEGDRLRVYHFTSTGAVFLYDYGDFPPQQPLATVPALIGSYATTDGYVTLTDAEGRRSTYRLDPETNQLRPLEDEAGTVTLVRWPGALHFYK